MRRSALACRPSPSGRLRTKASTWDRISPDLTRADPKTLGDSGGPITKDQNGPEIYGTIFTIAPSRHDVNTIWTGSDDGLVEVTRDGGKTWSNVTPSDLGEFNRISLIDASPHQPGGAYVAAKGRRGHLPGAQPPYPGDRPEAVQHAVDLTTSASDGGA
jgi:hypothetical protein